VVEELGGFGNSLIRRVNTKGGKGGRALVEKREREREGEREEGKERQGTRYGMRIRCDEILDERSRSISERESERVEREKEREIRVNCRGKPLSFAYYVLRKRDVRACAYIR